MSPSSFVESLETRQLLAAVLGAGGALQVNGTASADVVGIRFDAATSTLRVVLNGVSKTFASASVKTISVDLGDGNDRLDIASGVGGVYVLGGLGNDTINGGDGNDSITAGGGKDSVFGGAGDDRINGGPTADYLDGGDGADRIYGGDANDVIFGEAGVDRLFGGAGNDELIGGSSNDKLYGDDGNDTLWGGIQNDLLTGGTGNDQLIGDDGNDTLDGQDGADSLFGMAGLDTAYGDAGNDYVEGGAGNDWLSGGDGNDTVVGTDGNDTLHGDAGDDSLDGGNGADTLDGSVGDDSLSGGAGADSLIGYSGNDAMLGGLDNDTLVGGDGDDRFYSRTSDTLKDVTIRDAAIGFKDGDAAWSDDEIWKLDPGLRFLQQRTGNSTLLRRFGGAGITVVRYHSVGEDILGDNPGNGNIDIADPAFTDTSIGGPDVVIVHEIGHNWDSVDENSTIKAFFDLSHWRKSFGQWTYDPKAQLADYGRTDPVEDFATCLEVYYSGYNAPSNWQAKWNYIDGWLDLLKD